MVKGRPKFDAPPVVETVLGLQFAPLAGYTAAHAGWFWKEYLEKLGEGPSREWSQVAEAPPLEDQFERFGAEDVWRAPGFKVSQRLRSPRMQFIRSDGERMIQVQDTRFILNWRKQTTEYPSYETLLIVDMSGNRGVESVFEADFKGYIFARYPVPNDICCGPTRVKRLYELLCLREVIAGCYL